MHLLPRSFRHGLQRLRPASPTLRSITAFTLGLGLSLTALAAPTTLSVDSARTTAGATASTLDFPVTRSGDLTYDAYVAYHTADGSAVAGTDYSATTGFVRFPAGSASVVLPVAIAADSGANPAGIDKTLQLIVDNAIGTGPTPAFAVAQSVPTASGTFETSLADINSDGRPDLLIGVLSSERVVYVALNTTAPGAATPTFGPAQSFATGSSTVGIVGSDIDGDGRPDLIVTVVGTNSIAVLINTTAPGATTTSFAPQVQFPVGNNPFAVRTADFNGDGRPDIVIPNGQGASVSVLINTSVPGGTPAFTRRDFATPVNPVRNDIADINGDGRPDVVVASFVNNVASVLLNTTAPGATVATFAPQQNFAVGTQPRGIAAMDFNGDGRSDLATTNNGNGTLSILVNTTPPGSLTATFAAQQVIPGAPRGIEVIWSDLNGDGRPELLVSNPNDSTVTVFQNVTPAGSAIVRFVRGVPFAGGRSNGLVVGDINGDGLPDVLSSVQTPGSVNVAINTTPRLPAPLTLNTATAVAIGSAPYAMAKGDFNGDGRVDLAVANLGSNTASILFNTTPPGAPSPSFTLAGSFAVGSNPRAIVVGDFNGDGLLDLVTANRDDNTVSVLFNATAAGAASARFSLAATVMAPGSPSGLTAGDFNGDGLLDLAAFGTGQPVIDMLFNTTAPGSASASFAPAATLAFLNSGFGTTGDFNGDGRLDIAYGNGTRIGILLNNTAPGAATPGFAGGGVINGSVGFFSITPGDLNGDGRTDLVIGIGNLSAVQIALNNTAPGANTTTFGGSRVAAGGRSESVAVADFDGDGRFDLVSASLNQGTAAVALNGIAPGATTTASGDFTVAATATVGNSPRSVVIADFNGDGKPDFATANTDSNTISVVLNTQLQASVTGSPVTGTIHFVDRTPDAFAFTQVSNAARNTVFTSNAVTVSGLEAGFSAPVSITGGSYSIGCGTDFTSSTGTIANGQTVCVRQTSSPNFATTTTATLSISTVSAGFNVTALAQDITPDAFTFNDVSNVPVNSFQTSNAIVVSGISDAAPVLVTGGFFGVNGGSCTQTSGTVTQGDSVVVCHTASGSFSTRTDTRLTIGASGALPGVSDTFSSTTVAAQPILRLSPSSLNFGNQLVIGANGLLIGGGSAPQKVTLSNTGTATLHLGALTTTGDFTSTTTCGAMVATGASCTISVVFKPTRTGSRTGQTTITSDAASSPDRITLTGNGAGVVLF